MAKEKARYFTFLLYPESIPEDWELKLELLGVPIAVSPLHDKDLSDVEGFFIGVGLASAFVLAI